jgi:hypothetical protein
VDKVDDVLATSLLLQRQALDQGRELQQAVEKLSQELHRSTARSSAPPALSAALEKLVIQGKDIKMHSQVHISGI